MIDSKLSFDIHTLRAGYLAGDFTPADLVDAIIARYEAAPEHNAWIVPPRHGFLNAYVNALEDKDPKELPLYGIPFAIKDNIDLEGVNTTAACPAYAYRPERSATVVQRLIDAGAIPVGKTNLDQFATGLVGARSPYGPGRNSFNPDYVSGGSSSGSAITVAQGLASFSLGTDTAGSGRVPAAFNNLVGLKPSCGLLSTRGVVPACRSLDVVSIFALTAEDADRVLDVAQGYDAEDGYSRAAIPPQLGRPIGGVAGLRLGVPPREQLAFFGDDDYASLYDKAVERLKALGAELVEIDLEPFLETARLLYEGPWVAERYAAVGEFIEKNGDRVFPVTRKIIAGGNQASAVDAFKGQYRLMELRKVTEQAWQQVDAIVSPTAGTIYRIDEVEAEPVKLNSNLGFYTNFMNLLDLSAVAAPAGFRQDGMPFGVTLFAPAFHDRGLLRLTTELQRDQQLTLGATGLPLPETTEILNTDEGIRLAVCGAHMQGLPLNHQLTERGARFIEATTTAPGYRLYALAGGPPQRPGLIRGDGDTVIELEAWEVPAHRFGDFVDGIPSPLGIGRVQLADGSEVAGFVCEPAGLEGAEDVTGHGGWRTWLSSKD